MRSKCVQCGEPIRRNQLNGRWTHIGPFLSSRQPIHDPRPLAIDGFYEVETD